MTIAYFTNYLNHHQLPLADAFNSIQGVEYFFVTNEDVPLFRQKLGYVKYERPYLIEAYKGGEYMQKASSLANYADVAIFTPNCFPELYINRLKTNKLTFESSEHWIKNNTKFFSPNLWKHQMRYYRYGRNANLFMLCASAYAANDYYLFNSYKDRCYKWAYFTQVPELNIRQIISERENTKFRIMWCSRFIDWKHPELIISLARHLKNSSYDFEIDMYGNGPLLKDISNSIENNNLTDCVYIKGNETNDEILHQMRLHNALLFTSDRNEGWGAVANEAMSNGCTLVASSRIGSVPYLVKHNHNGLIFQSNDEQSLFSQVSHLIDDSSLCERLAVQAYKDMNELWSPKVAANRFLNLVENISSGKDTCYKEGPCSKAMPIKYQ